MSREHLVKNSDLTPEERQKRASKAGKASVKARQERKTIKERLLLALELKDSRGMTKAEQMALSMIEEAIGGDVRAFVAIRDTVGEKPKDEIEIEGKLNISSVLASARKRIAGGGKNGSS